MLIGIDASRANKEQKTGVEWYAYHLIEQFKKIDKENSYILYSDKSLTGDLKICPENFKEKVLHWPLPRFWTLGRLSLEMLFSHEKPDVLFVPAHTIPLVCPQKTVVTVHDIGFEHFPKLYKWADKLYHKFSIRFIKFLVDKIITVSNYSKNDIAKFYNINENKISAVYNGFDNYKYKVLENSKRLIAEKYILFIGRLEEKKNIFRLVEAFALFKKNNPQAEHKLVLIGKKGFGFERVEKLIRDLNLTEQIILPGWVSDNDLPVWLNNAELFVFPSLFEGFGIPVLEAMACGCPVVCSNTTSLPEALGDCGLMFDPVEVESIKKAMSQVLFNEQLRKELIDKGLNRVKDFSWEKCARETLKQIRN